MAVNPEVFYTGNGTKTDYTFSFEYIDEDDIKVSIDDVVTTAYSFANATTILFSSAPANLSRIRIYRDTNIDSLKTTFFAGSSIRAQDLNQNFEQNNYAVQEIKAYVWDNETDTIHSDETWVSSDTQIATTAAIDARFQDEATETIESGETWVSDDDHIATTAAIDARFQDELDETITSGETWTASDNVIATTQAIENRIDEIITNDIGTDGTGVTVTDDGDGTITLGLGAGTIDLDRLKASDVITLAEQNASPTTDDDSIFTSSAAAKRFDTIVQLTTPTGTDYEVGKTWLQNDDDKTVSIWNGSQWVPVASGGAFTELSKVVYVDAVNGDDSLAGHRISNPKRTIKAAMDQINAETDAVGNGSMVIVAPGIYAEEFPITIQKNDVSIVGTSLRNCIVHPAIGVTAATAAVNGSEYRIRFVGTTDFTAIGAADNNVGTVFTATGAGTGTGTLEDTAVQAAYDVDVPEANELSTMFQVNSGTYIQNLTLQGMKGNGTRGGNVLDTDATFGLPTQQGWNFAFFPGATIRKSPYIQNCTNFSDSQINNVNFTPHVPGEGAAGDLDSGGFSGGGILIDGDTVAANSPLRSMVCDSYTHTALNGPGIFVTNNGYTQVTSSYAFFTHYHLKCLNGGQANLAASTSDFGRYSLVADGRSTTNIFTADLTVNAGDQATTFTIGQPTADASWHGNATRPQPNMLVQLNGITYPILSSVANGLGWDVEISRPDPANRSNNLGLNGAVNAPATAQFFLRSQIASSGHTMEYVGSGTDYRALPENATGTYPVGANDPVTADATAGNAPCGVPSEERQTVVLNNGAIWTAVTDHNGKFRVGGDQNTDPTYEVDQQRGRVTFRTGSLSFPTLIENLDTNGFNIFDSTGHVNINDELDVNSNKIVNVTDPTAAQDAATKNYVDTTTTANPIYVAAAGDTMSGDLAMGTNKVTGVGDPTAAQDAATKNYVDTNFVDQTSATGSAELPAGTTGDRDGSPNPGYLRFNTTLTAFEGWDGTAWSSVGGGLVQVADDTTPQLGGDLDVQTNAINTSTTNGDIDLDANGSGLIKVTEFNLTQVPIVTQHDIGTAANEVPLNGMLGGMAFQDPASVSIDTADIGGATFDSSGRLGIGTTSPSTLLQIGDSSSGNGTPQLRLHRGSGSDYLNVDCAGGSTTLNQVGGGNFYFATGGTERMRLSGSTGNLAIGSTNTTAAKLYIQGDSTSFTRGLHARGGSAGSVAESNFIYGGQYANDNSLSFANQHSSLVIEAGSNQATNSELANNVLCLVGGGGASINPGDLMKGYSYGGNSLHFRIQYNGNVTNSNNSYGSLSDERLKQDIVDAGTAWEDLKQYRVRKFRFISDVERQAESPNLEAPYYLGVVAQEIEQVSPGLVDCAKLEDGSPDPESMKNVKYSVLYMKAVKALQEAMERIETLETKVAALEGGTN